MIAVNEIHPNAAPAFAGCEGLRTGVSDAHRRGLCGGMLRLVDGPAVPSRSR